MRRTRRNAVGLGLLFAVASMALTSAPAQARPNCDVPNPPPICGGDPPPPRNRTPIGSWDEISFPSDGGTRYRGWAFDPDTPSATLRVQISVTSDFPGVWIRQDTYGNSYRPDVAAAYPAAGAYHGFDLLTSRIVGTRTACVDTFDTTSGERVHLGCRSYTAVF